MVNNGVWHEILLRVDPYIIFDCILVCKSWLEVIAGPEFRQSYQKRWKTNSKLVGFTHGYSFNLLATSTLGHIINENRSTQLPIDFFITKSGEGDGLILYGSPSENMLYVSKAGENRSFRLHIPANMDENRRFWPWHENVPNRFSYDGGVAILSQRDSYKVIMVGRETYSDKKIIIQTYSSSTGEWQVSEPVTDLPNFHASVGSNSVMASSKRGVVYWPDEDSVTSYDANNGCISNIDSPDSVYDRRNSYGLSPEGYLQCATSSIWGSECDFFADICKLDDDDDDDKRVWKDLHSVDSYSVPDGVSFVSLVPGRSDCIFVKSAAGVLTSPQLSLYNFHTRELVPVCHIYDETWDWGVPLTMADLGVWPSSPFSDATRSNIDTVKRLLTWDLEADEIILRKRQLRCAKKIQSVYSLAYDAIYY